MPPALENLCGPGKPLKPETPDANEITGLLRTGGARLHDAQNTTLALESRFDLAYNAAHALCLAALRRMPLAWSYQASSPKPRAAHTAPADSMPHPQTIKSTSPLVTCAACV
jgi:hypothetical protein